MDPADFPAYALDPARTLEERYTIERLCERGVGWYNARHQIYETATLDEALALHRERKLNPAYQPRYSEDDLRKTLWAVAAIKDWSTPYNDRPVRSLAPLRYFSALTSLTLNGSRPDDLSPLANLPALHTLSVGGVRGPAGGAIGADYTPLARCRGLRHLALSYGASWPDLTGIETLSELETLTVNGNFLALPPGIVFPRVRRANFRMDGLPVRGMSDLPALPACEFLGLHGVERLEGIEAMPRLRNLTLGGAFDSFAPLQALRALTCLSVGAGPVCSESGQPGDVSPLAECRELRVMRFEVCTSSLDAPRDYAPLAEAPALREVSVSGCPPVETEIAAIQAGLPPWDDVFLLPEPRPVPPLRLGIAPMRQIPQLIGERTLADEGGELPDEGLLQSETRWVAQYAGHAITARIGYVEWGQATAYGTDRGLRVDVESFDVVNRLPEIVEATRTVLAALREDWRAMLMVSLKIKRPEMSPAQIALDKQLREERDQWDFEQRQRDHAEYLERLHQMELRQQQGEPIAAEDFSPTEPDSYERALTEARAAKGDDDDEDENGEDEDGEGGTVVKHDPEPPPSIYDHDEDHPLAKNYGLMAWICVGEMWCDAHHRGMVAHLMGRGPDVVLPEEPAAEGARGQ